MPWWAIAGLASVAVLAVVLYTWMLSRNGMGNSYYAAAVKSASLSWKAFLFGSLDPGSFITIDKLPAAFWVPALFARVFGFSSWSILLPQALAGVASVLILHRLVRRWAGDIAALLAALAFALTPVAVLIFRLNNPDAFLTLLFLLAAWAVWSALETGATWKLAAAGAAIGFALLTKMLEALLVLPALGVVYLVCGPRRLWQRALQLLLGLATLAVAAGWWIAIAELWPAASRPYIGGSADNSVLSLIFSRSGGYLGDLGPVPDFAGDPGWLRLFNAQLGGEISWLIPLALVGLATGMCLTWRAPRDDKTRAGYMLWGLWALVMIAVFSGAQGVLHPYYAVVLAPALAALAGAGSVALWRLGLRRRRLSWLLPAAVAGTALWSGALLRRTPGYAPGLDVAIVIVGVVAAVALVVVLARLLHWHGLAAGATILAVVAVLGGPFAYVVSTVSRNVAGPLAAAGPYNATLPGPPGVRGDPNGEDLSVDDELISYLKEHREGAKYLVGVQGSSAAVPLILASGEPVLTAGGFNGGDPWPTVAELERMVAAGEVHFFLVGGRTMGPPGGPPAVPSRLPSTAGEPPPLGAGPGAQSAVVQWVVETGRRVPAEDYGGTLGTGTLFYLP
jgi:4-amino-4-deoxy-L-arabinose transferase-like glycosyltransferase